MTRLPKPGEDNGNWGEILNDFLEQSHNDDGSLKEEAIPKSTNVTTDGSSDTKIPSVKAIKDYTDGKVEEVNTQLDANTTRIGYRDLIGKKKRCPMMVFIDDDGEASFSTKWYDTITQKNVPVCCAVITNKVGAPGYLTWEQIAQLQAIGVEMLCHTNNTVNLDTLPEADLRENLEAAIRIMREHGCESDILVYPGGAHNEVVRRVTRDYFRAGIQAIYIYPITQPPLQQYAIPRVTLAGSSNNSLDFYKRCVDQAVADNGLLIWMSHSFQATFDATQIGYIRELIDYARGQGVEIIGMAEAISRYGNLVDVGDYPNQPYTVVDCDGTVYNVESGTTANRPQNEEKGHMYYDTTLSKWIALKTPAVRHRDSMRALTGATTSGNITITIGGVPHVVAVAAGDSITQVRDKIKATPFPGWWVTETGTAGQLRFFHEEFGAAAGLVFADTDSTGVTASRSLLGNGVNAVWTDMAGAVV